VKLLKILFCYEKKFEPRFVVLDKWFKKKSGHEKLIFFAAELVHNFYWYNIQNRGIRIYQITT
jgi:hypothetical protein